MIGKNAAVLLSVLLFLCLSCRETLPPRTEPAEVLVGAITIGELDTVEVQYDAKRDKYTLNASFPLKITLQNVYDDLLQGKAKVDGKVVFQTFGRIPNIITVPITLGNLMVPPVFRGDVALPPKKTAEYDILWIPVGDNQKVVYLGCPSVPVDSALLYGPVELIATAEVSLFERVQPIKIPGRRFTLLFKEYTIGN